VESNEGMRGYLGGEKREIRNGKLPLVDCWIFDLKTWIVSLGGGKKKQGKRDRRL
jgi:hypothetical protein